MASPQNADDGDTNAIWTVNWYAHMADISSDGLTIVRHGPWPGQGEFDAEALSFISSNGVLRSYKIRDLVTFPQLLPQTVSHFAWLANARFDYTGFFYSVETLRGERYEFDCDGSMFKSFRRDTIVAFFILGGTTAAGLAIALWSLVSRRSTKLPA